MNQITMRKNLLLIVLTLVATAVGCGKNTSNTNSFVEVTTEAPTEVTVETETTAPVAVEGKDGWSNMRDWVIGEEILFTTNPNNDIEMPKLNLLFPDKVLDGEPSKNIDITVDDINMIKVSVTCAKKYGVNGETAHKDYHIDVYENSEYQVDLDSNRTGNAIFTVSSKTGNCHVSIDCLLRNTPDGSYNDIDVAAFNEWADRNFEYLKEQVDTLVN